MRVNIYISEFNDTNLFRFTLLIFFIILIWPFSMVGRTLCNINFDEKNYEKNLFVVVQNCVPHLIKKFQLVKLTGCLSISYWNICPSDIKKRSTSNFSKVGSLCQSLRISYQEGSKWHDRANTHCFDEYTSIYLNNQLRKNLKCPSDIKIPSWNIMR